MNPMDAHQILRLVFALLFVLALMGLFNLFVKRFYGARLQAPGRKRRLNIVETLPLDARRRLVLLRRDGVEHLVILGPSGETVIERGIETGQDSVDDAHPATPVPFDPVP